MELSNHIATKNIFHTFLNPETKVSADAFGVHGYSDEFLSNKPKFKEDAKRLLTKDITKMRPELAQLVTKIKEKNLKIKWLVMIWN